MKKIIKNQKTLDEKLEDFGTSLLLSRYNLDHKPVKSLSDIYFYVKEYTDQYNYYLNDLKHSRCNVSNEAHFVFSLPFIDAIKFTILLYQEFGFFYYPGMNHNSEDTFYDKRYYEVKKEFISKKYHIPYVKPETRVTYILCSVFPNKKAQNIAYGVVYSDDFQEDTNRVNDGTPRVRCDK